MPMNCFYLHYNSLRVVVKRPDYAEFLGGKQPHFSRETKNHRFDIYMGASQC